MQQSNDRAGALRNPQAAAYLGIAESTLNKLRLTGDGPIFIKIGRSVIYRRQDLDAFLEANRRASTSETSEAA